MRLAWSIIPRGVREVSVMVLDWSYEVPVQNQVFAHITKRHAGIFKIMWGGVVD